MPVILAGLADFAAAALAYLSAVAAFLLAVALVWLWIRLARPIFLAVAHIIPGGWRVLGHTIVPDLRGAWLNLETAVYNDLITYRNESEAAVAFTWHWMAEAWRWNAGMVEWLAKETEQTFDALAHIHLPKWGKWIIAGAFPPLLIARLLKSLLPHLHAVINKPVQIIYRTLPAKTVPIVLKAVPVAIPGIRDLPWIRKEVHGFTKRFARINWRLRRLEALLTTAGVAVAMAKALGLGSNWRCLTRGNIGRAARHFCGLDRWIVDFLLLGSVEAFIASDLCEFSDLLIKQAELLRPALMELVDVEDALIGCHGTTKPLLFKLPAATLPPLQGVSPLAA